jgi:hypothetical protein
MSRQHQHGSHTGGYEDAMSEILRAQTYDGLDLSGIFWHTMATLSHNLGNNGEFSPRESGWHGSISDRPPSANNRRWVARDSAQVLVRRPG